jgi:2-polyprenyl-6-hydroxyphenyl methylase/3-demethylubiquinone-9 3-methyltransferase
MRAAAAPAGSIDPDEAAKFAALADRWWDTTGPFQPLHRLNPVRIAFIRDHLAAKLGRDPLGPQPLKGARVLDVGCGGGLLAEPLARLGATVTAIDAGTENLVAARAHAEASGLEIDYRDVTVESLAATAAPFDAVLAMEVVEHVSDLDGFLAACGGLTGGNGVLVLATINRTLRSFLEAKIAAEYLLRWVPAGTHDWRRFPKPSELAAILRRNGLSLIDAAGVGYVAGGAAHIECRRQLHAGGGALTPTGSPRRCGRSMPCRKQASPPAVRPAGPSQSRSGAGYGGRVRAP